MSATYNPELSDVVSQIRFYCGDANLSEAVLQDEEIQALYNTKQDVKVTAKLCMKYILQRLSQQVNFTIGPTKVDASDKYDRYLQWYKQHGQWQEANIVTPGQEMLTHPSIFGIGMQDNL